MKKQESLFLRFLLFLSLFLRFLLLLISSLPLYFISSAFRKRRKFEKSNKSYPGSTSFKKMAINADLAIHVSSEGELEQVRPILDAYLDNGQKVELLFTSASVEKKVEKLFLTHSDQLRILRLPLLTIWPLLNNWVTAPKMIMVRYDFFPELLFLSFKKRLFLIEATLKNKKSNPLLDFIRLKLYSIFEKIICASQSDLNSFIRLGISSDQLLVAPLRTEQIYQRLMQSKQKLAQFNVFNLWQEFILKKKDNNLIIFANYWEEEKPLLESLLGQNGSNVNKATVIIVPHILHDDSHWREHFKEIPIQLISSFDKEVTFEEEKVIVFNLKGILVELYSYIKVAYVGGGFGRSVHSLAEPFVADCFILCGPKVHRSTEYDYIKDLTPDSIQVLSEMIWPKQISQGAKSKLVPTNLVKEAINFIK